MLVQARFSVESLWAVVVRTCEGLKVGGSHVWWCRWRRERGIAFEVFFSVATRFRSGKIGDSVIFFVVQLGLHSNGHDKEKCMRQSSFEITNCLISDGKVKTGPLRLFVWRRRNANLALTVFVAADLWIAIAFSLKHPPS